jgi:hypothetical protein
MGGEAGETATLISFELGDLEQATMVSARTAANNARKKRFMGIFPILLNWLYPDSGCMPSIGELVCS